VAEDYLSEEISVYKLLLLAFFVIYHSEDIGETTVAAMLAFLFYYALCLAAIRIADAEDEAAEMAKGRHQHGYLPILAASIIIYYALYDNAAFLREAVGLWQAVLWNAEGIIIMAITLTALIAALSVRLKRAEKAGRKIICGWGEGDVIVLAILAGALGFSPVLGIFFISLAATVSIYIIIFIKNKRREGLH
jgi:phosphatidylserine synthase